MKNYPKDFQKGNRSPSTSHFPHHKNKGRETGPP